MKKGDAMKNGQFGRWIAAMSLGMFLALAPQLARAEGNVPSAASEVADGTTPPAADSPETAGQRELRYARREAATPQAASFKGQGSAIYIGGSTLAIVLIIVLIVVLL
jgi:hypothetical protein